MHHSQKLPSHQDAQCLALREKAIQFLIRKSSVLVFFFIKCDKNSGKLNDNDFNELKLVMKNLIVDVVLGKKYLAYKLMSDWLGYQEWFHLAMHHSQKLPSHQDAQCLALREKAIQFLIRKSSVLVFFFYPS
jgi:mRNA-degrading endonuclease YafQ of YafQ-DinJ toxin-antitoxin module